METTIAYWGYIGIMEKNMETTTVFRDYVGKCGHYRVFCSFAFYYVGII